MKKFNVYWEVSKYAIVEAKNEKEAIEKTMNGEVPPEEQFENEITCPPEAEEMEVK